MKWLKNNYMLTNVQLYDGSGSLPYQADVAVKDGYIEAVAKAGELPKTGWEILDCRGLDLTPGFVDVHSHSDNAIMNVPSGGCKLAQGITTEGVGNCGFSEWHRNPDQGTFRKFAEDLEKVGPGINIAGFSGHNTLRLKVVGDDDREATPSELAEMKRLLVQDLEDGAVGFSSGLWYVPGRFSPESEPTELASALKGTGKPYATHMRDEEGQIIEAIEEACRIAAAGDGILQISHFKVKDEPNWHLQGKAIETVEKYQRRGLTITADRYPYLWTSTHMGMAAPPPFVNMERREMSRRLHDSPELQQELIRLLKARPRDWTGLVPVNNLAPEYECYVRKNILEISKEMGCCPEEAYTRIMSASNPNANFRRMCQKDLDAVVRLEYVFPACDGSVFDLSDGHTHPRAFGTFPTFYKLAIRTSSPEAVIRRMSYLPAQRLQLFDRGLIRKGYRADMILLHLDQFDSKADFETPNRPAEGIVRIFVNGQESYRQGGEFTPDRSGQVLRIPNRRPAIR